MSSARPRGRTNRPSRHARAEAFHPLIFAALCSSSFVVAAERIRHYKRLVAPMEVLIHDDHRGSCVEFCRHRREPLRAARRVLFTEDPNSFFRAFHAWTGKTTEQARLGDHN